MLLDDLIDGFLLDCRARHLSPFTIERAYAPILRELSTWLDNPEASRITPKDLRGFVSHVSELKRLSLGGHPWMAPQEKPLSAWTLHRHVRVIRRFFNWTSADNLVGMNPASNLS